MPQRRFVLSPDGGDVEISIKASDAQPLRGYAVAAEMGALTPVEQTEPSSLRWVFMPQSDIIQIAGFILPLENLKFAPNFELRVSQGGKILSGVFKPANPVRVKTRKVGRGGGQWAGTALLFFEVK